LINCRREALMMRKVLAAMAVATLVAGVSAYAADAPKPGGDYVGAAKCKMCHKKEYTSWAETKHAHAFESLKKATPEQLKKMNEALGLKAAKGTDDACAKCHVTGFGAKTGYPSADTVKNAILAAVSCEDCHGPGGNHMAIPMSNKVGRAATMVKPTAETCSGCHTKAVSPTFKFEEKRKLVHPIAAAVPAK
jgi:hypothetical protein